MARYASLQDYLRVIRERWIQIVAVALAAGVATLAYSAAQPKSYEASARLNVRQPAEDAALVGENLVPLSSPQAKAAELTALGTREAIAERTAEQLDTTKSPEALQSMVDFRVEVQTNLVIVAATADDPEFAADLANEYAEQVQSEATRVERERISAAVALLRSQLNRDARSSGADLAPTLLRSQFNELQALEGIVQAVDIVSTASVPSSAVAPRPVRNLILGLLLGGILGVVIAFARDSTDTRLKAPREVETYFGLPRVGQLSEDAMGRTVSNSNGSGALTPYDLEAARIIRTNLEHLRPDGPPISLAVTSPLPGEGKSTVAMALASVAAMSGKLTLLIECDLRQPVIADRLGLEPKPGLSDVMLGKARPRDALQTIYLPAGGANGGRAKGDAAGSKSGADAKLVCLTAGTTVPNPAELLASQGFVDVIEKVTKAYEVVILDTSPLLSVVDTRELLPLVDGAVVCARSYQTTREHAHAVREVLDNFPDHVTGLVVTGVRHQDDSYYNYYTAYGHPDAQVNG